MTRAALRPFIIEAERDVGFDQGLYDIRDQLHDLTVDLARRVADDDGSCLYLLRALNHITEAHRRFIEGVTALIDRRAAELAYGGDE